MTKTLEKSYVDLYLNNLDLLCEGVSNTVNRHRSDAIENFNLLGIPSKKIERYKYTDLQSVFSQNFEKYFTRQHENINLNEVFNCGVPDLDTYKVYLINGFFYGDKKLLKEGDAVFGSLASASQEYPEVFEKHYNRYAHNAVEGLAAMNTAFAQDGMFVYIPKGSKLSKPIQLIKVLMNEEDTLAQNRNLFIFEEGTEAKVIICNHTVSNKRFLTNAVTEVYVGKEAKVEMIRIQNEHNQSAHITSDYVRQDEQSVFSSNTITLHGGLVRNNINILLDGEHCENHTYGLFFADNRQHMDSYTFIDHAKPSCTSNELFKGVLDDSSVGAFNGSILVRQDAQKTQAFQANNNLLLAPEARMYTKPQLEIYADDVKCSHGATIGQLNDDAVFYMQSRGIGKRDAQLLQLFGFAYDVVQKINIEPLRENVADLIRKRLNGELAKCKDCPADCY